MEQSGQKLGLSTTSDAYHSDDEGTDRDPAGEGKMGGAAKISIYLSPLRPFNIYDVQ